MHMESTTTATRSIWGIIGDVFFAPIRAFDAFKQKPSWVTLLILTVILAAAGAGLTAKQNAAAQYDLLSTSSSLPAPFLEQARQSAQNPNPIGPSVGAGIVVPVISLIGALIAWFLGSFVFGQKAKYWHVWAVGLLAGLIPLAGGILGSVLIVAKDSVLVSLGPAALLAGKDFTSILYSLLYFTDVFAIWGVIVAGLGYASIFSLSRAKGMTISIIIWIIGLAFIVGSQQIGLAFAGVETSFL